MSLKPGLIYGRNYAAYSICFIKHHNHFFVHSEAVLLYNIGSAFHTSLLLHFPPLLSTPAFFTPAFSTPAICSRFFHSCIFHPCCLFPHFPLLHFPPLLSAPEFFTPVFSTLAFLTVSHFPLPHFQPTQTVQLVSRVGHHGAVKVHSTYETMITGATTKRR